MNKLTLAVNGEDGKVSIKLNKGKVFNLVPENARNFANALHQAADHAEGSGWYQNEVTVHYRDPEDNKMGFETESSEEKEEEK